MLPEKPLGQFTASAVRAPLVLESPLRPALRVGHPSTFLDVTGLRQPRSRSLREDDPPEVRAYAHRSKSSRHVYRGAKPFEVPPVRLYSRHIFNC